MLALAVRVERQPRGTMAIIGCLFLLGISFVGRLAVGASAGDRVDLGTNALVAVAALVGGWGAATCSIRRDESTAYARVAGRLQSVLPLCAAALTPVLLLVNGLQLGGPEGDPLAPVVAVAIGLVLGNVLLRQSLLLRDRERAVLRERKLSDELRRAEETYRSMVELVPAVIYVAALGPHGRWHYVSPRVEWLLGFTPEEWTARLPIDVLKIDRSFIAALRRGHEVPVLVRSIVKLGQTLRMEVLAEGIEREEQLVRLRELGCRLGQGFYFSPPVPASGAAAILSQRWPIALAG